MLSEIAKEAFSELNLPYCAAALKFCRNRPLGFEQAEDVDVFCSFLKKVQDENKPFYTTIENDICMGRVVLGMTDFEANHGSGQVGYEMGVFKSPAANARLYHEAPMLKRGVCNFVLFCPLDLCNFDPDLVICITNTEQAQLLLRATSYISGDLWESKSSYVMSCAWTYVYPYVTGKVNHLLTGMHFGLQIKNIYPQGLHIITIPFTKLDEVTTALREMEHVPVEIRTDEESRRKKQEIHEHLEKLTKDINMPNRV